MFSSFAKATGGSATMVNPFAAAKPNGGSNPFGNDDAGHRSHSKRKDNNPFQTKDANLSDGGGKHKGKRGRPDGGGGSSNKGAKGRNVFGKAKHQQSDGQPSPLHINESGREETRGVASFGAPPGDMNGVVTASFDTADPLARKVYERLRRDGISPPQWPSQPGNPENKQAMARFREQYEAYRKRARLSLTKAGLIDDPEKRKALSDAIEFKGICEDMCPEFEKITRITELDIVQAEKDPRTTYADTTKMVKKLARSAAGQEAPLPMDVRSVKALRRSLDYLMDDLLRNDGNLPVVHGFLWDRTRAIRRDFSFFSSLSADEIKTQVYVLENIARFHVTSLHLLSQEGRAPEDFVEQQELEQLGKALLSLRDVYDDCNEQGIKCENESEFRAYYLLFHAGDPSIMDTLQRQWKPHHWRDSDEVRTAVSLVEALQNTYDFHGPLSEGPSLAATASCSAYFRIVCDASVSYTMACFAECHFPQLRRSILHTIKRSLARPKTPAKDVSAATLNKFLQFDTTQQAVEFAQLHDLEFVPDPESPADSERRLLVLDPRRDLPHRRLQHQFSQRLVERKRSSRPLPEVIHQTVFESPDSTQAAGRVGSEDSLFVQDHGSEPTPRGPTAISSAFGAAAKSSPSPAPSPFGGSNSFATKLFGSQQGSDAPSPGSSDQQQQQSSAPQSPFASFTPSQNQVRSNPFAAAAPKSNPFAAKDPGQDGGPGSGPFGLNSATLHNGAAPAASTTAAQSFVQDTKSTLSTSSPVPTAASNSTASAEKTHPFATIGTAAMSKSISDSIKMPPPPVPHAKVSLPKTTSTAPTAPSDTVQRSLSGPGQSGSPSFFSTERSSIGGLETNSAKTTMAPAPSASTMTPSPFGTHVGMKPVSEALAPSNLAKAEPPRATGGPCTIASPFPPVTQTVPTSLSDNAASPRPGTGETAATAVHPPMTPAEPRDLMADFTKWFVLGDDGILEQFKIFIIEDLVRKTFDKYTKEVEEKRRKEEEERINQEVEDFRRYNLSLKYFYRWKHNARRKRLSLLRRSGRDQLRAFYASQHAAQTTAQKAATRKAEKQRAALASVNRPEEFLDMLKRRKTSSGEARDALLSSGVLAGVENERQVVENIVRNEFRSKTNSVASSHQSRESSPNAKHKYGAKTKALRDLFLGKPEGFRRSLPSISSRESVSTEHTQPRSNASARWRLKAMGIEQLPDGTAVPASMARDMRSRPGQYSGRAFASSLGSGSASTRQRASSDGSGHVFESSLGAVDSAAADNDSTTHKRKRPADEGVDDSGKHQRIMSEAEKLTSELKAIRKELEEGREWFRSQNDRLRSESHEFETNLYDDSM